MPTFVVTAAGRVMRFGDDQTGQRAAGAFADSLPSRTGATVVRDKNELIVFTTTQLRTMFNAWRHQNEKRIDTFKGDFSLDERNAALRDVWTRLLDRFGHAPLHAVQVPTPDEEHTTMAQKKTETAAKTKKSTASKKTETAAKPTKAAAGQPAKTVAELGTVRDGTARASILRLMAEGKHTAEEIAGRVGLADKGGKYILQHAYCLHRDAGIGYTNEGGVLKALFPGKKTADDVIVAPEPKKTAAPKSEKKTAAKRGGKRGKKAKDETAEKPTEQSSGDETEEQTEQSSGDETEASVDGQTEEQTEETPAE